MPPPPPYDFTPGPPFARSITECGDVTARFSYA